LQYSFCLQEKVGLGTAIQGTTSQDDSSFSTHSAATWAGSGAEPWLQTDFVTL